MILAKLSKGVNCQFLSPPSLYISPYLIISYMITKERVSS